ncbi:glycosyltransferase family 4 protein [Aerococcus urinaeequi]|uniref:glycosyltransferase family 4 protein n=1 Tax=Aerococcus urinaeequi TaxID=51665 RepID=UPI003AAB82E5
MKILYITTLSNTINAFLIPHIEMLIQKGHTVDVACCIEKPIDKRIYELGCVVHQIPFSRKILKNNILKIQKQIQYIVMKDKYDVIHTHTPIASAISRNALKNNKNVKKIYTAHGFHFFKGAPLKNWIIYYPIEKYLSKYTDSLITINKEDYKKAKQMSKNKVYYTPGIGLDLEKSINKRNRKQNIKKEFNITEEQTVLLSVGELNENKNHETVIKSLARVDKKLYKYIICGEGHKQKALESLVKKYGMENNVILAGFRNDIPEIMKNTDIFIFPSYREGLSVALMEAMASGLPVICSDIRGNTDLIDNHKGGIIVLPKKTLEFEAAILELIQDNLKRVNYGLYNKEKILQFSLNMVLNQTDEIYLNMIEH